MPPTRLISFDLDGTLVDTAGAIATAANDTLQHFGLPARAEAEVRHLIGDGSRALMLQLLARICLEQPAHADTLDADAVLTQFQQRLIDTLSTQTTPYPGVPEALAMLKAQGVLLACVSNKEASLACQLLRATGLEALFTLVIGGDTLPEKKPHASVLRHVLHTLRCEPEQAAHVGDSATDVAAARNAGLAAWAVPYGYNAGRPITESRPDQLFNDLTHLVAHVMSPLKEPTCP